MRIKLINTFHKTSMITKVEKNLEIDAMNHNYLTYLGYYGQEPNSYEKRKLARIHRTLCPNGDSCRCGAMVVERVVGIDVD